MSLNMSYLGGLLGFIFMVYVSATLKTRKYVASVQDEEVWPKLIYQTLEFKRKPSV